MISGCTLVAKNVKSKQTDGINLKPQQHIATKESEYLVTGTVNLNDILRRSTPSFAEAKHTRS